MIKPIYRVSCSPALAACQRLMQRFALWLCDPTTTGAHISHQALQPPVLASVIEADWLWNFLQYVEAGQSLLSRAQTVAAMPPVQKAALATWVQTVTALATQFQPAPTPWPVNRPIASKSDWLAFKTLMESFYKKGFRSGLPFLPNGTPTVAGRVNYAGYVSDFRNAHRVNLTPHAREVCVLCGGPLGDTPHVDHWITKSAFPLLSVCEDNLQLICSTCNEAPNKGDKDVYSDRGFIDWFHPYLRPGNGALQLDYILLPELTVKLSAVSPIDQLRVEKIDALLNLTCRWTREFKAEFARLQGALIRREQRRLKSAETRHTQVEIQSYIQQWQADLAVDEPHYEVHTVLAAALQEPVRIAAWHSELALVK
ncbi:hypothetical protein ACYST8_14020 [Pseudomonas inefficax]